MDEKLLILINQRWTSPALDKLMAALSSFAAWVPFLVILIVILVVKGGFRMRVFLLTAGVVVAVNDGVLAHTLKTDRRSPSTASSLRRGAADRPCQGAAAVSRLV
jgi:hypothetical protein